MRKMGWGAGVREGVVRRCARKTLSSFQHKLQQSRIPSCDVIGRATPTTTRALRQTSTVVKERSRQFGEGATKSGALFLREP